jgi:hypothetical protein
MDYIAAYVDQGRLRIYSLEEFAKKYQALVP